jgi:predicted NBD/HSP70 family sugar kinase
MSTPQTNFIGISVSGTRARAALVNDNGLVGETRVGEIAPKTLIPQLAEMVQELQSSRLPVSAIGVAIPGLVNRQTDRVVAPRDFSTTIVEDLHGELTRATGLRV